MRESATYVVERGDLRWSFVFPELDGRSRLDGLGGYSCWSSETPIVDDVPAGDSQVTADYDALHSQRRPHTPGSALPPPSAAT